MTQRAVVVRWSSLLFLLSLYLPLSAAMTLCLMTNCAPPIGAILFVVFILCVFVPSHAILWLLPLIVIFLRKYLHKVRKEESIYIYLEKLKILILICFVCASFGWILLLVSSNETQKEIGDILNRGIGSVIIWLTLISLYCGVIGWVLYFAPGKEMERLDRKEE